MLSVHAVVADTSVFVAILLEDDDAERLIAGLRLHRRRILAAGTYLECALVGTRRENGRIALDTWLVREKIEINPVDHASRSSPPTASSGSARAGTRRG
ncbi:MAG TPA: type II toxin-antitoxin system VapC family toxin [Methylobacterium sp.]